MRTTIFSAAELYTKSLIIVLMWVCGLFIVGAVLYILHAFASAFFSASTMQIVMSFVPGYSTLFSYQTVFVLPIPILLSFAFFKGVNPNVYKTLVQITPP